MKQRINILLLGALVMLSGCVLTKKQRERYLTRNCSVKDSVVLVDKIVLKDTTVFITTQGPIQYLENPCKALCDSLGNLKPFEITKKENGIVGTIKSVGNSIAFNCKADSLEAIIRGLQEHTRTLTQKSSIVKWVECDKDHVTGTQWYWIRTGQWLLGFLALQILIGIGSIYLPFLKILYLFKF
jgi:hypothetical protein